MDEFTAHGVAGNYLCEREVHPKKLMELCYTLL
jgi:hypothetical protein